MHDIKDIRKSPSFYELAWAGRGLSGKLSEVLSIDAANRAAQTAAQDLQAARHRASDRMRTASEAERAALRGELEVMKARQADHAQRHEDLQRELDDLLASLPNIPSADVPDGSDEHGNVEQRRWGDTKQKLVSRMEAPKDHVDLGQALGGMDFHTAALMSGTRFVLLKGQIARLERALGQFMLDLHTTEHGYTEVNPPLLVRAPALFGTAQLPKFEDDLFRTTEGRYLIPTAEVSLTNMVREQILDEGKLPIRVTALTACFRSEAGSAGRDTRGMIRQHQFNKVELVSVVKAEDARAEHERMTACAEEVLRRLDIPHRVMLLCKGDMGFGARKTYDLEAWIPSQHAYREISSCSDYGDFTARRMDTRVRIGGARGTQFVHTLNGSGVAVGRALVAVLENYQDNSGKVTVPDVLRPYMGGTAELIPE
jgi:seryl-tRNA synthetase